MNDEVSSFTALSAEFVQHITVERKLSRYTARNYTHVLNMFDDFLTDHAGAAATTETLMALEAKDFRAFLARRKTDGVSATTLRLDIAAIRAFFRFLSHQKNLNNDTLSTIRTPKLPPRLPRPLTRHDTDDLRDELKTRRDIDEWQMLRDFALITILYGAGLRISEALTLRWSDAPFGNSLLINGKGGKSRMIPVIEPIRDAVHNYQQAVMNHSAAKYYPERPTTDGQPPALFFSARGKPLSARMVQKTMQRVRQYLGLPDSATPHALRHSFATHLLSSSGDLRGIQELLGHSTLAATQRYTAIDTSKMLDVYKKAHPRG